MSQRNPTKACLIAMTLLILVTTNASGQTRRYHGQKEYLPYTRNLPRIDRVELFKLKLNKSDEWDGGIIASRTLAGRQARKFASLWRRQTYNDHQSACHNPGWAIKFYAHQKLFAYATVCFSCNNISMIIPELTTRQNFGGYEPIGEQLEQMLSEAFAEGKGSVSKVIARAGRSQTPR